ncbi:MAG: exodeoxyribonuclease VII large subunit [Beijerinckiaceae bacterium]|nr:exodeoxyribonuclease VII large subunit [Beijerinckiaceae bacterium]
MDDASLSNAPEFSVTELSGAIKRTMEDSFERVRVRGEISGYRGPHSSGHCYFGLKDQNAKIDAIIWKGVFGRLKFRPEEGMEVIATGKVTTYPGKSSYQIVIDQLEPAGVGALLAQLEARKRKLAAEGLFDPERKRTIPYLPRVIGVITSPTGAVIRDIIHRIEDRFPRHVLVWPVRVQGDTCASEVAAAIAGFNALGDGAIPRPDVLIVARGGGSLEDLWGFNEEIVARAVAAGAIPLISAVGHETDTTLIDFVSDRRAPTPTGAAEFAVPVRSELIALTRTLDARLSGGLFRHVERRRSELRSLARALPGPDALLNLPRQRLDIASHKLPASLRSDLSHRKIALGGLARRISAQSPHARLGRYRERLDGYQARLAAAFENRKARERQQIATGLEQLAATGRRLRRAAAQVRERKATQLASPVTLLATQSPRSGLPRLHERLEASGARLVRVARASLETERQALLRLAGLLNTLGYRQVLARGFAIIRDEAGRAVREAALVKPGMPLEIGFADGSVTAVAGAGLSEPEPKQRAPSKPASKSPAGQGSLF